MEPLPPESPFWELPNVIVSPHSAAASDGLPERVAAIFCDNLRPLAQRRAAAERRCPGTLPPRHVPERRATVPAIHSYPHAVGGSS